MEGDQGGSGRHRLNCRSSLRRAHRHRDRAALLVSTGSIAGPHFGPMYRYLFDGIDMSPPAQLPVLISESSTASTPKTPTRSPPAQLPVLIPATARHTRSGAATSRHRLQRRSSLRHRAGHARRRGRAIATGGNVGLHSGVTRPDRRVDLYAVATGFRVGPHCGPALKVASLRSASSPPASHLAFISASAGLSPCRSTPPPLPASTSVLIPAATPAQSAHSPQGRNRSQSRS